MSPGGLVRVSRLQYNGFPKVEVYCKQVGRSVSRKDWDSAFRNIYYLFLNFFSSVYAVRGVDYEV